MEISIDLTSLVERGVQNPLALAWWIFVKGGWVVFLIIFVVGLYFARLEHARRKYREAAEPVLLALDIPKENEQSLKAIEQIFAQLHANESHANKLQRFWQGKVQSRYSLELVSIDGYIQYLIRSDKDNRDLVEAAIYAQYPDAEITEVGDYTDSVPNQFPNKDYDLWGAEFVLAKNDAYPIRTYRNFEHTLTQKFADPMASLLEALSRLQPGEQTWLQIIITPTGSGWTKNADRLVKKLIGEKTARKKGMLSPLADSAKGFGNEAVNQLLGGSTGSTEKSSSEKEEQNKIKFLTAGAQSVVEAIEEKMAKIAFRTKIRLVYIAKKEIFDKNRGVRPVRGAILQYNTQNLNAFETHKKTKTKADYIRVDKRIAHKQRKILRAYKMRANHLGIGEGFIMNIEELASIFHFPIAEITVPPVQRTEVRKGGAPTTLPREFMYTSGMPLQTPGAKIANDQPIPRAGIPENLPIEINTTDESKDGE
ncbi:hypothetical protein KKA01_01765 [Patescibacteria group bacterium]|nr:hypothetical protein [Patescibacteria group bacterium]